MATLQTIRSKGPLLVVVIGLALFAFIAGDAWKVLQPHQGKQDVGEVNGKTLTAQEYQKMVDEYTEVIKLTQGVSALNDDQLTQVKDQVWQSYVNNQLIAAEAAKLGLTVSKAEVQAIIEEGTNPLLMQTPFRNPQTGAFDKDMLKKFKIFIWTLILFGSVSCVDNDNIGPIEKVNFLQFDFPQGNALWDKEIEQIAKDWGMYIIYKNVDSTHLNRMWTIPYYTDPIYVCSEPSSEDIQIYLDLVQEWLLGSLDKTKEEDKKQLPYYLYLVNDLNDGNPQSQTYQKRHIQFKKDGLDYWSLSFTSEELAAGLTPEIIHSVACAFSYPSLKVRFETKEYKIAPGFAEMSDYETEIGRRYLSYEQWKEENPYMPDKGYYDNWNIDECDKDEYNAYQSRGFAVQLGEDFKPITNKNGEPTYGAPTWMPWIVTISYGVELDRNPGPVAASIEERVMEDFMNMIRTAMTYSSEQINEKYPLDIEDPIKQAGNKIIIDKYNLVIEYMKNTYNIDLTKYAEILNQ